MSFLIHLVIIIFFYFMTGWFIWMMGMMVRIPSKIIILNNNSYFCLMHQFLITIDWPSIHYLFHFASLDQSHTKNQIFSVKNNPKQSNKSLRSNIKLSLNYTLLFPSNHQNYHVFAYFMKLVEKCSKLQFCRFLQLFLSEFPMFIQKYLTSIF